MTCSSDENDDFDHGGLQLELTKFTINFNTQDSDLKNVGTYKIFSKPRLSGEFLPKKGLYVVHGENGIKAYSTECPYIDEKNIRGGIYIFEGQTEFSCSYGNGGTCNSHFNSNTGLPTSGPAKDHNLRLLEYKVTPQEQTGVYLITND